MYTPRVFRRPLRPGGSYPRAVVLAVCAALLLAGCATNLPATLAAEYFNLGNAYVDLARFDAAVPYYRKAIELDGGLRDAQFNLALALVRAGGHQEAQQVLAELRASDPENLAVLELIAFVFHQKGDDEAARTTYLQMLELQPGNTDARYNLAIVQWKLGDPEAAAASFLSVLEVRPEDLASLANLAEVWLEVGETGLALEYLNQYLQAQPDDALAMLAVARARAGLERYGDALDAYESALTLLDPSAPELGAAWFEMAAVLLTEVQDPNRGLTALEEALAGGFRGERAIVDLVGRSDLLERDQVLALLTRHGAAPVSQGP